MRSSVVVDVVDAHPQARVRECEAEWQTDVAGAAEDDHVERAADRAAAAAVAKSVTC